MAIDSLKPQKFLCASEEVPEGQYLEFRLSRNDLATIDEHLRPLDLIVTRHLGTLRAWLNVCPHQGRSLSLAPGRFITDDQNRLVCCVHGAVFEPDQGLCVQGPCANASLTSISIAEREGQVYVQPTLEN